MAEDPRSVLGVVAATVYAWPAEAFTLIGDPGTQGKTTPPHLLTQALAAAGRRTDVIGALGPGVGGRRAHADHTPGRVS